MACVVTYGHPAAEFVNTGIFWLIFGSPTMAVYFRTISTEGVIVDREQITNFRPVTC